MPPHRSHYSISYLQRQRLELDHDDHFEDLVRSLAPFAAANGVSEAANLRQAQRSLGATYSQSNDFLSEMLAFVNKERAAEGLPPVCGNKKLQSSSQRHSDDMAQNNYMAHDGADGSTMSQRITDAGYKWGAVGENVAAGQEDVQAVMDAWIALA
ncbi:hypothetical protein PI126_g21208 [Phytophthora idaei]|nr:hypothetical protein PI126_g21208 [Phytophthora idaei]